MSALLVYSAVSLYSQIDCCQNKTNDETNLQVKNFHETILFKTVKTQSIFKHVEQRESNERDADYVDKFVDFVVVEFSIIGEKFAELRKLSFF